MYILSRQQQTETNKHRDKVQASISFSSLLSSIYSSTFLKISFTITLADLVIKKQNSKYQAKKIL